MIIYLFI